jgi:probable HAF family extracellular repeat protein
MLTDLGTLPGGTSSCGAGVNTRGVVVGLSTDGSLDPLTGFPAIHAVRWRDGKIQDLGTLGGNESYASFINDRGQITGAALNAIPDSFTTQLFIGATQVHAFLWDNESMHDLGTLGGANSIGWYINQRGEIAGQSFKDDIPNETTGIPTIGSFLWRNGKMLDLGSLGGTWGTPNALNNVGQVVGTSDLEGDEIFHPFLWERGSITDLGTLGGSGVPGSICASGGETNWKVPGRPFGSMRGVR